MPGLNRRDTINLLSKLTPRRAWNGAKVLSSYYISKWFKKPVQWGLPISISFEPTTSCNLRCPECPSGLRAFTRPTGMLQQNFLKKRLISYLKIFFYLVFYFQGEPYLNPDFLTMVNYASRKRIYTATSTNAHYLTSETARKTVESGLDRLIISIDGTTQEVYKQYRVGGDLNKVIDGTKHVLYWKKKLKSKTPFVVFQFLVVRPNEHQVEDVKKLGKELGVDAVWFKTAQVYDFENDPNNLIPLTDKFSRYEKTTNGNRYKGKLTNSCWRLWHDPVITWDGLVAPCCFDKDASHNLGDLKKSFKEIWKNGEYSKFRTRILKGRKNIDICANCTEGTKVWTDV